MGFSFLSYSRTDTAFAERIAHDLTANQFNIWFDQTDIPTGHIWDIEVEQALINCDTLIVLLSDTSVKSKNVLDEIYYAYEKGKKIIPLRIEDCEMPFRIKRVQYIDFTGDYDLNFKKLCDTLNGKKIKHISGRRNPVWKRKAVLRTGALLLLLLCGCGLYYYLRKGNERIPEHNLAIFITNFSTGKDDDFSYSLYSNLKAELDDADTISLLRTDRYFDIAKGGYDKNTGNIFSKYRADHGLLVFGKRSTKSKMLECNILMKQMEYINYNGTGAKQNVIHIRNPDLINFSIDYQAEVVADFILGLIYYSAGNDVRSNQYFTDVVKGNNNQRNQKLLSLCYFFIGNSDYRRHDMGAALNHYRQSIGYNPLNALAHYNQGCALLSADTAAAMQAFHTATALDPTLPLPLADNPVKPVPVLIANLASPAQTTADSPVHKVAAKVEVKQETVAHKGFEIKSGTNGYGVVYGMDTIVPFKYEQVMEYHYKGQIWFIVKSGNKYGAVTQAGKLDIPVVHPSARYVQTVIGFAVEAAGGKPLPIGM